MTMFEYVMVLASIILGLGITHLLAGVAEIIQHPKRAKPYWAHLVWVAYMFLMTVFWWWWQFRLQETHVWTFQFYFFILCYAFIMYLLCALLFPRAFDAGEGFKEYFYSRRAWFFGIQALYLGIDMLDSWFKGAEHFASLGTEYVAMFFIQTSGCVAAMFIRNERFQEVFAVLMLLYQASWVLRYFDTIN